MSEEDREELAEFVAQGFAGREPLTKYSGESVQECYDNYAKPAAYSVLPNLSFVCIDHFSKNGNEIIGCHLCKEVKFDEIESNEPSNASKAYEQLNNDFKRRFLDLHKNDQVKDYLFIEAICVKQGFGKKGIATNLFYLVLRNAKQLGYQFALVMPTANEVKHIVKYKLNAKKIFAVNFEDVQYNDVLFFEGIADPRVYEAYEISLADVDIDSHRFEILFDLHL
ncbi:hypothetical protein B4U80_13091 [Leptotrombidium deliense]|uniref:N-acetyltransferase domain-containing protein n=1 Tax=Leptotrombidium deliense TaxID=299467 RepID=A0A443SCS5_9ACAR|nr:hypothetical protein B4U80_13091 [Leptotrombidium deliense]